jgi:hypothetical protein
MVLTKGPKVVFTLIILMIMGTGSIILQSPLQSASAFSSTDVDFVREPKAPVAISGENVYITWWTNNTENGNDEVLFRSSTDGGTTFEDKINLSNTTVAESIDAMIDTEGDTVVVTWWERNSTSNEPVMRISNDAGQTFGPLLQLSQNGTLGSTDGSEE